MKKNLFFLVCFLLTASILLAQNNQWVWVKGDSVIRNTNYGVYGILGVAAPDNRPGTRENASTWKDINGNFWLFGGNGYSESNTGLLNDLWKYDPITNLWTWVGGSRICNVYGIYGTIGIQAPLNQPGAREQSVTWVDQNGNFWLFGGNGNGEFFGGYLNDLWMYNVTTNQWSWMKGDKNGNSTGVYGSQGVASSTNKPGSRSQSVTWVDSGGNLWLFGGFGYGELFSGRFNDLWKYSPLSNQWIWIKGDKTVNVAGVYGSVGIAALTNKPGARYQATGWVDTGGNLWLFGGYGMSELSSGILNDLWMYNPNSNQWTWMNGDKVTSVYGIYGTQGVPSASNKPGSRTDMCSQTDGSGNFLLFGGNGYAESTYGLLNDLWKYNPSTNQWVWVKGDKTANASTVYGTQGISASTNIPGGRQRLVSWFSNNLIYIYGGSNSSYIFGGSAGFNELWSFNTLNNQWTWVRDYSDVGYPGIYGNKGVFAPDNKPGSRSESVTWTDASGNLWLFGGSGKGGMFQNGYLNDLWKYDPNLNQWAWVNGDTIVNTNGIYGVQGVAASNNRPGSRIGSVSWVDASGNLWLFGGEGNSETTTGLLNDLWRYSPVSNQWTWVKGDKSNGGFGVYGTLNVSSALNKPGARRFAVSWTDGSNLWLQGGEGYDESGYGLLSDLWKFNTVTGQWVWVNGSKFIDVRGNYGAQGVFASGNIPGGRKSAVTWKDLTGNFWLFGGYGFDRNDSGNFNAGYLSDLWKYNPLTNQWAWINGSRLINTYGNLGIQGVGSYNNNPGRLSRMNGWTDQAGDLWLFGGYDGFYQNHLWKYKVNTNQWSWIRGSGSNQPGVYGSLSIPNQQNMPGSRSATAFWKDINGNFWLLGGYGFGKRANDSYELNDLWKFSPCTGGLNISQAASSFCNGTNNILLTASGGGGSYTWYRNNTVISGQTSSTYTATSAGTYHATSVVGSCTLYSGEAVITPATIPPFLSGTGIYCNQDFVNVGIPVTEVGQDYTWRLGSVSVQGPIGGNGGNQSLNFNMTESRAGTYRVTSTKTGCDTVFSNYVFVGFAKINGLITSSICADRVSFNWTKVAPDTIPQKYEYYVSTSSIPPDYGVAAVTSTNNITQQGLNPSTLYYIHVRSACGFSLTSFGDWVTISFTTKASNQLSTVSPNVASLCSGNSQSINASSGTSYQWLLNGAPIPGANSIVYNASIAGTYTVNVINNGCSLPSSNNCIITVGTPLPGTSEWTGAVSRVWTNASNWLCGQVPTSTTAVIVNGGKPFYPLVISNITLKSLTVNTGGNVEVSPGIIITLTGQ